MSSEAVRTKTRSLVTAVGITLAAGVLGLPTLGFEFPSFPFSLATIGWELGTVAIMVLALRLFEQRRPTSDAIGLTPFSSSQRRDRARVALIGIGSMMALTFFWDQIPGLRELAAAGDESSYGSTGHLITGLLAFELAVRYPIGVIAEESFFRGFLQPRIAVAAPVLSGLMFGLYHLQQWETIPSLIPFGIALGLLRWWTGSIWPGVVFHYVGNAIFILSVS